MTMERRSVCIVPFTCEEIAGALQGTLSQLSYPVTTLDAACWLSGTAPHHDDIKILLFGSEAFPQDEVCATLHLHSAPQLSVIGNSRTAGIDRVIGLSNDIIFWPCHDHELDLRLSRLEQGPLSLFAPAPDLAERIYRKLNLVGTSTVFRRVLALIGKVARFEAPVLIEGETGTGKELAARAIHYLGARQGNPFIPVNCGCLPENLVENELFGHRRGAFTDAREDQAGLVEHAEGGTLFLDELEALSEKGQVTLLRFIQDREYRPLGARQTRRADVRIIAASNMPLAKLVESGRFRQDLYYRLCVLGIEVPPLRERNGDVKVLAAHFLEKFRREYGQPNRVLPDGLVEEMTSYHWPGNVRELENFIHRVFVLEDEVVSPLGSDGAGIGGRQETSIPLGTTDYGKLSYKEAKGKMMQEFEQHYLTRLMSETGGNVSRAARLCGKERRALGRLLKKYEIVTRA